jgi:hypothetical protein
MKNDIYVVWDEGKMVRRCKTTTLDIPKPPIDRIIMHNRWPDGGYDTCPKCGSSRKSGWFWSKNHNYCIQEECEYSTKPIPKKIVTTNKPDKT